MFFKAEGLKSQKFARAEVCEKKNMSFKRTLELIVGCPEKFRWRKISGEFPHPPPLKMMVPGFFFQIISFGNEALQKIGEVSVFFKKHFLGIIVAFLHGES